MTIEAMRGKMLEQLEPFEEPVLGMKVTGESPASVMTGALDKNLDALEHGNHAKNEDRPTLTRGVTGRLTTDSWTT